MRLLSLLAALGCLLHAGQARPQRQAAGPPQLSGAAANSMAPLTSEWRDQSVRRLSSGPEGDEDVALSQSPYAWKPLVSERTHSHSRTSRDQQQNDASHSALTSEGQPVTAPSAPSSPSAHAFPSAPPTGASPIGESLKEVASQLMEVTAAPAITKPQDAVLQDVRTPPIVKAQDLRKPDIPKPVMVSATVSTEQDDDHVGFQGVAEPVVLPEEAMHHALPQALPQHMPQAPLPLRSQPHSPAVQPAMQHSSQHSGPQHSPAQHSPTQHSSPQHSAAQHSPPQHSPALHSSAQHPPALHAPAQHSTPQHSSAQLSPAAQHSPSAQHSPVQNPSPQHSSPHHSALKNNLHVQEVKKAGNASASPMTTAEPQPSTTSSDRISTWILLSGTHSTATTPSSLKKRPTTVPSKEVPSKEEAAAPLASPKTPSGAVHKPGQAARPPPRKPAPVQRVPGRKPAPSSTTTTTTTTTSPAPSTTSPAPSTTPKPAPQVPEYVKISEAVVSSVPSVKDSKPAESKRRPAVHTESKQAAKRPVQDKTKVTSASVPFNPAISFRRKPVHGQPIQAEKLPKPAALKTTAPPTTTTPAPEELTTLPSTQTEIATTDADLGAVTTVLPPVTTKAPKRTGSSSSKKKKKKNKNKNRRRRPTKKKAGSTSSSTVAPESKIGHEVNGTKVGQNGISTKIYNYLAREVMPSVSVGIIGLVVTAGIAGLFLYPFGGGIAARRTYDTAPHQRQPGEHMYHYESYADQQPIDGSEGKPEEEVLGHVFSGMQQQQQQQQQDPTRFSASPSIYGGGDSGPPDAQYPDSYSRYDGNTKGSSYSRPEASSSSDLRQDAGYSSVNGQAQVTGYAGYADPSSTQVESKFEPIGTLASDALQRTRYDVDTPADQVDLTYASVGESAPEPSKKKAEESPYVVGSSEAQQQSAHQQATHQQSAYGSSSDNIAHPTSYGLDTKPTNRYSVRLSSSSGQAAESADGVKLEQADRVVGPGAASVDLTYGAGLDLDGRYATANGAQPRAIHLQDGDKKKTRRRRSVKDGDDMSDLNEIDGPVPMHDAVKPAAKLASPPSTTMTPAEIMTTTMADSVTTTSGDSNKQDDDENRNKLDVDDKVAVTDPVTTDSVITNPSVIVTTFVSNNDVSSVIPDPSGDGNLRNKYGSIASSSERPAVVSTTTAEPAVNTTDDPLSALFNIFRRVAEFKLRVGMNLLRGTSEAVSRYIGGVTKRMEEAAEHLQHMRNKQIAPTASTASATATSSGGSRLRRRVRDLSKTKHQLKKMLAQFEMKKKKQH